MRIGILLHPYDEEKPGGLARTILEWTRGLLAVDRKNEYTIFLREEPKQPLDLPRDPRVAVLGSGRFWLENLRGAPQADVYLFQTPVLPLRFRPKKTVVIVQDFPYKHLPSNGVHEWFLRRGLSWYHGFSLARADAIVAVSEATKQDIVRFFDIAPERISVVHMGFKSICKTEETPVALPEKFFLYVGVVKERKNILNIVRAFAAFKKAAPQAKEKLVIAGKVEGAYAEKVKRFIGESGLKEETVFLGYLNDNQLSYVYRRATALAFPSLIEGFGFPVLEAMECGTPVITANRGGPSEIGKAAAMLVIPENPEEIARAFGKLAKDPAYRKEFVAKGIARAKEFSWEKASRELLRVIESA